MLDRTHKAERYWALMLKFNDFGTASHDAISGKSHRKVAARYRVMAT
jgi:hypothetical protein